MKDKRKEAKKELEHMFGEMDKNMDKILQKIYKIFEEEFSKKCPEHDNSCLNCREYIAYKKFKEGTTQGYKEFKKMAIEEYAKTF